MLCALLILCLSAARLEIYAHPLRSEFSEDAILVANNRIHVPLGRSVFVDPVNDLVVQTQPGDRCSVMVLEDDHLAQRPGRLSPGKFPCDFGPRDVMYTHYGSKSVALDRVRLQLRYDEHAETLVIPFVIEVEVVFTQMELLTRNMPLSVTHLRGTSDAIDRKILDFTYDREAYKCGVTLAGDSNLPRYGRLRDGGKLTRTMDCDELTRADIRYEHTFQGASPPNQDHVPMVLELRDGEGNTVKREYFHLTVRIVRGQENTAPKPSLVAMMTMEVSQFAMTALTPEALAADDAESDPRELVFNVTLPLSLEEGYIVSTDDQNLPITSFYQQDLQDLKIAYKPPSLDAERIFQLEFEVLDPEGAASDPFAFIIVVKPMNSLAPVVTHNAGQLLYEGQSRPLVTGHNLEIGDKDNLEEVSITVVDGLHHGVLLVSGARGDRFSAADLAAGAVVYQHDGSDTYSDNVVFKMTDGEHHVEFLFPITVVTIDDEPPVVNVNTGLVLFEHQMMSVSPLALSAADIDSEDSTVKFTVVPPFSTVGTVLLRQSDAPEDPSSWKFNSADEVYEKEVREWLQKDITDGKLFYKHVGPHNVNMDLLVFTVQDDNDPPNESGRATFVIRVVPVDNTHWDSEDRIASDDRGQVQSSLSRRPERVLRGSYLHQRLQHGNQDHYESSKRRQQADGPMIRRGPVLDLTGEGLLRGGPRPRGGRRLSGGAAEAEKLLA
ncbi:FRAS1-related extracellular matrix protein 2-like [Syngnathus typhle]